MVSFELGEVGAPSPQAGFELRRAVVGGVETPPEFLPCSSVTMLASRELVGYVPSSTRSDFTTASSAVSTIWKVDGQLPSLPRRSILTPNLLPLTTACGGEGAYAPEAKSSKTGQFSAERETASVQHAGGKQTPSRCTSDLWGLVRACFHSPPPAEKKGRCAPTRVQFRSVLPGMPQRAPTAVGTLSHALTHSLSLSLSHALMRCKAAGMAWHGKVREGAGMVGTELFGVALAKYASQHHPLL